MGVLWVLIPLMGILIFLLPRKADPGKRVSPAGMFALLMVAIIIIVYFVNR